MDVKDDVSVVVGANVTLCCSLPIMGRVVVAIVDGRGTLEERDGVLPPAPVPIVTGAVEKDGNLPGIPRRGGASTGVKVGIPSIMK